MLTRSGGAPTRVLLLVTTLLALAGGVLLGLGLQGPAQIPEDAMVPLGPGATLEVGDDGFSLWSLEAGAFETAVCTAAATPLQRPSAPYSITVAGTEYHEVARSPRALLAGSYAVTCTPGQDVYAGPHAERTAPSVVRGEVGVIAGAALLVLALVVGVVALLAHRRQRRLEAWRVPAHRLDPDLRSIGAGPDEEGGPVGGQQVSGQSEPAVPGETSPDPPPAELRPRRSRRRGRGGGAG